MQPVDTVTTTPNEHIWVSELRQKRGRYRRLAQSVTFDHHGINAIITMQPVTNVQMNHQRRFMVATAFAMSEALLRFMRNYTAKNSEYGQDTAKL